ncbi:amidase [Pseudomonas agarici]|uniref:Amidase n=1 Tax=Pseudomonas agarici TaxID=46677 RepID=A0A0X1T6P2_PSEAA|nr:amidase family protein [Pseudomonas agarici]AMB87784.1 amidase [Pseudomonas agarici]NWB94055.1 amidase [Pseudomonas agarici]NWC11776.1 amidase [Pseudomonas agarici]SEL84865.1 amidase [Pseudomonas agarici]
MRRIFTKLGWFTVLPAFCLATSLGQAAPLDNPASQAEPVVISKELAKMAYADATEVARALAEGLFTSEDLVGYLVSRAVDLDSFGPAIEAVIEFNPDVLSIARTLDEERRTGTVRGPLHGIPVLLKDNIHTADRMQTAGGSLAMVGAPTPDDAFIVQRLREQGAIILGKTNMSEWANFRGDQLPDGWSSRGGLTKNPHALDGDVCGSSSGSGAAVAAGYAPLSVGTETFGSVICPASRTGIVGMKPSVGLLSRAGIIPASRELDSAGPMTRTVRDAALLLNAMAALDPQDLATAQVPVFKDYTQKLKADALQGKIIGYPSRFKPGSDDLDDHPQFAQALDTLRRSGAQLVPVDLQQTDWSENDWTRVSRLFDMTIKRVLPGYLASRSGLKVSSLQELVDYNERHPGAENYDQELLKRANALAFDEAEYLALSAELGDEARRNIDRALVDNGLDAILGDPHPNAILELGSVNLAGYPGITVPSGMGADGLPTSVYFFAARWSEAQLLAIAYGYEQASLARQDPDFE